MTERDKYQNDLYSFSIQATSLIVDTVKKNAEKTISEIGRRDSHFDEIFSISNRLSALEDRMICKEELIELENSLEQKFINLENNLKTFITQENTIIKEDIFDRSQRIIKWAEENLASKKDIVESENKLLWKLVGAIVTIISLTAGATFAIVKLL